MTEIGVGATGVVDGVCDQTPQLDDGDGVVIEVAAGGVVAGTTGDVLGVVHGTQLEAF